MFFLEFPLHGLSGEQAQQHSALFLTLRPPPPLLPQHRLQQSLEFRLWSYSGSGADGRNGIRKYSGKGPSGVSAPYLIYNDGFVEDLDRSSGGAETHLVRSESTTFAEKQWLFFVLANCDVDCAVVRPQPNGSHPRKNWDRSPLNLNRIFLLVLPFSLPHPSISPHQRCTYPPACCTTRFAHSIRLSLSTHSLSHSSPLLPRAGGL